MFFNWREKYNLQDKPDNFFRCQKCQMHRVVKPNVSCHRCRKQQSVGRWLVSEVLKDLKRKQMRDYRESV